ncbi:MAG: hypothetical protein HRT57_16705, partial [Crocinitomicaceae bacterium]|nr:hypothetical protein [Crocinitomicaceae bacterium]
MPTNQYINNFENAQEQKLLNDLVEESIKFYGIDVYWVPRTFVSKDDIYGEDVLSKFTHAYPIEMYIKNVEGFEGEGDFLSRFGLEIRDQITFTVSQRRFDSMVSGYSGLPATQADYSRPREGDLIYFPLNKKIFEIKFVEHEERFYPLGTLPVYDLRCELFVYSSEKIDTGIPELDKLETDFTYANTDVDSTTNEGTAV